ncbi:MAG: Cdc6/Cdc18 family protein [Candidatus Thorarchaeota archaeon]
MINKSSANNLDFFTDEFRFRDMEFDDLLTSFRQVLNFPGEANARVILIGPTGSGKSFVLQNFQNQINNGRIIHPELKITLNCVNIDCSKHESSKSVVFEIIKTIDPYFKADLDECYTAELQYILADILLEREEALVIIFDNIDTLVALEPEEVNSLIYGFQRFSEGKTRDDPHLFSQILVAHDLEFLNSLDKSVFRRVVTDVIPFEPYTAEQTFLILKDAIKKKIRKRINEETIWFIAMISQGNMRLAIELLEKANSQAQQEQQIMISPEHIRMVNEKITDFRITKQAINDLPSGEKLLLLTVARRFQNNSRAFINFLDLPGLFFGICEEYNTLQTAKYFSEILSNLEKMALIAIHNIEREVIVTLSDISATKMASYLEKDFIQKRRDVPFFT